MITIYLKQYNKIVHNPDLKMFDELGYDDILWIDLMQPTIKEQKEVENFMEISLQTRQQIEEIETTSKYSETENAIFTNTNFLIHESDGSFKAEPVSFAISEGVLITVRQSDFRTLDEAVKRLQMNYRAYPTGYHLLISILEIRIDADADMVEAVSKKIAQLSKEISEKEKVKQDDIRSISGLQESVMSIREVIFDRQRVLSGILKSERFPNDIYPRLQLMIRDVSSIVSHADFSFERLDFLRETALNLLNLEMTNTTKIFSVAAVIFMPPTLVSGIYGMNFKLYPDGDTPGGFWIAIGIMLLFSLITILWFRYKKWL